MSFPTIFRQFTGCGLLRALLISASAAVISSCSTLRNPVTPDRAAALRPGEGLVAASFASKAIDRSGRVVPVGGKVTVLAKGLGTNKSVQVSFTPEIFKKEQSELVPLIGFGGTEPSDVVAIPLPEGEYEITGWRVADHAITADVYFSNRLPMKVPFHVKAGETTYLGRMNSLSVYGKNFIGLAVPGEALVIISDQYQADVPRISKNYPSIHQSSIRKSNVPQTYMAEMKRISNTPSKFFGLF
ncbi:MAG: hypothetical protein ABI162_02705 [Luteolibacter sp.]